MTTFKVLRAQFTILICTEIGFGKTISGSIDKEAWHVVFRCAVEGKGVASGRSGKQRGMKGRRELLAGVGVGEKGEAIFRHRRGSGGPRSQGRGARVVGGAK